MREFRPLAIENMRDGSRFFCASYRTIWSFKVYSQEVKIEEILNCNRALRRCRYNSGSATYICKAPPGCKRNLRGVLLVWTAIVPHTSVKTAITLCFGHFVLGSLHGQSWIPRSLIPGWSNFKSWWIDCWRYSIQQIFLNSRWPLLQFNYLSILLLWKKFKKSYPF